MKRARPTWIKKENKKGSFRRILIKREHVKKAIVRARNTSKSHLRFVKR